MTAFSVLTAVAAVVSVAAADQPLWNVPFPDSSVSRLRAAVTTPDTAGAASAPAVVVEESHVLTVLDAKTGNRTYRFQLELGADPASLAPAVVGGNTNTDFRAWSTVTGATLWTAPKATVSASNEHLTVLTVAESSFQIRATATGKVYLTEPPLKNSFPATAVSGPYVVVLQKARHSIALHSISGAGGANAALRSVWAIDLNVTGQASDLSLQVGPATAGAVPYVIVKSAARGQQWVIDRRGRVTPLPRPFSPHVPFRSQFVSLSTVLSFTSSPGYAVSLAVVNVATQKVEWSRTMSFNFQFFNAELFDDLLLVTSYAKAFGVDAQSGKVLWTKASSIAIAAAYGPDAIAVSAGAGLQVWSKMTGAVISKTRSVAEGVLGFVAEPSLGSVVVLTSDAIAGYNLE